MKQIVRRKAGSFKGPKPEILAPAGNRDSFLAALAAGADAIYCGLKSFSARMAARNFQPDELASLIDLAHRQGVKVYLTVNTLIKPDELSSLGRQLQWVSRHAGPDALIVQDLALPALARQAGFKGEIHLSTLANVTMASVLPRLTKTTGVQRVVLPRELNIEEIKQMADVCPKELGLEVFVHGALCYGVSGRCYWSSFLGGKSGLRGRCVQPCRRVYSQIRSGGRSRSGDRFFSCQDFSLDVLVKVLADIPRIRAWKIEGRKKGPHYVYYTVAAYKMLRDEGHDAQSKKAALGLLEQALGRPTTHYNFLPQRPQNPVDTQSDSGSGQLVGTVRGGREKSFFSPRINLLEGDKLRVGYEDEPGHQTVDMPKSVPKGGKFFFKASRGRMPATGASVFLIDRREPYLAEQIDAMERMLEPSDLPPVESVTFKLRLPPASPRQPRTRLMHLMRYPGQRIRQTSLALWLSEQAMNRLPDGQIAHAWWWLPPVVWPEEEPRWRERLSHLMGKGARRFVLNAPWQISFFHRPEQLNLWAGPFCNIANPMAVRAFKLLGGQGVIVSPELGLDDMKQLADKSVLPLGAVVSGQWPFCVSRVVARDLKAGEPFVSPKGEQGWVQRHEALYWVYPNWPLNFKGAQNSLTEAGYRLFVHIEEPVPKGVSIKKRPGDWNLKIGLK